MVSVFLLFFLSFLSLSLSFHILIFFAGKIVIFTGKSYFFSFILGLLNPSVANGAQHVFSLAVSVFVLRVSWSLAPRLLPQTPGPPSDFALRAGERAVQLRGSRQVLAVAPPPSLRPAPASSLRPFLSLASQKSRRRLTAGAV